MATQVRFCAACGAARPEGAAFCSNCGTSFTPEVSATTQVVTVPAAQVPGAPAASPVSQVRPVHVALGASIAMAISLLLPWFQTPVLFGMQVGATPLDLAQRDIFSLLLVLTTAIAVIAAAAAASSPRREANRTLRGILFRSFIFGAGLAIFLLVVLLASRSRGGAGLLVGIGIGAMIYIASAVVGVVAVRRTRPMAAG